MEEIIEFYKNISLSLGGEIKFLEEYGYFPVLMGSDNQPVPLFFIVESMDGNIDYDYLIKDCPTLNYSQINMAIKFLRKISAINGFNKDIDDLEDDDEEMKEELINALKDDSINRVVFDDNRK